MRCTYLFLLPLFAQSLDLSLLKSQTQDLFFHSYDSYITHSYPKDELNPLTCTGRGPSSNDEDYATNDVCGDYLLTLVDALDTLAIIDPPRFQEAVYLVIRDLDFDKDVKIQVFEGTIRILGGLLSAHAYAKILIPEYKDELIILAIDFADRLLPAFNTPTGIPHTRVNLKYGMARVVLSETCSAAAGSLILEFGELSRVTGNPKYEKLAKKAFFAIWDRRSDINLVGITINPLNGDWTTTATGVGAGVDSFYEYALKAYIVFGDPDYYSVWTISLQSIQKHIIDPQMGFYKFVDVRNGELATGFIDSLSAFFPGLLVLDGHINLAEQGWEVYAALWKKFGGIPERWNFADRNIEHSGYPLRPEFIESTYYLYQATKDPKYLYFGERILHDLINRRVECGVAGVQDLLKNELDDHMDSYFLGETLKYLYLLFDAGKWTQLTLLRSENPLNKDDRVIFTTEGHPIWPRNSDYISYTVSCPVYNNHLRYPREEMVWYVIDVPHDYIHVNSVCPVFLDQGFRLTFSGTKAPDSIQTRNIKVVIAASLDGQTIELKNRKGKLYLTKIGDNVVPKDHSVWLLQSHYYQENILSFSESNFITLTAENMFYICTASSTQTFPSGSFPLLVFNNTACSPLPYDLIRDHIVVVNRGECDFSVKSNNVLGARMIIVTDRNDVSGRIIPQVDQGRVPLVLCGVLGDLGNVIDIGSRKKAMYVKGQEVWNLVAE
ncbi:ER degradation-enhancing alpha-mannosidase-like protein 1 [Neolecta irregularis DAH-3]|uniref:alpha-1,2-Mannosidase n=1 Tax=Neolecta irregularis (strain DAH-3) TaxID=1198029 RepID=A0A1U7LUF8_NEOID|nr:ER degradation-enhancing alpha-mannosidase-like protein 1 [Neolecta irregularis DAH-3]|eukprot:OLL26248.1 ER degradation-enhancing alpha-mannosidase-like protein 1 [Neolecta irregularis DAH-3]